MTITRSEMLPPMLAACPTFGPGCEELAADQGELYIVIADLGSHIWSLVREQKAELIKIFDVIEDWQVKGDAEVKQLVSVGLMERLKYARGPKDMETRRKFLAALGPASRKAWNAA